MYLSPDDHQANDDAREHLVRALKQVPCKPFDVDPETDDEPEPDTGDATKDDEDADVGADTDDSAKDDEDADVGADTTASIKQDTPSFDVLFVHHSQFMETLSTICPVYTQYVKWATEEQRVRTDLVAHREGVFGANQVPYCEPPSIGRFNPFLAIRQQHEMDQFHKRTRQLQTELKQLQGLQSRFLADVPAREAAVRKWEAEVKAAWAQVLPQLVTHGVPLRRTALRTMEWLHEHRLLSGSYTDHVDVGHAVLTATLPYTGMVVGAGTLYHVVCWSQLETTWRFYASMVALYRCYPWLRTWQTSSCRVRADVLAWSLLVWSMADESAAIAWWCGLELLVHWLEYIGVGTA